MEHLWFDHPSSNCWKIWRDRCGGSFDGCRLAKHNGTRHVDEHPWAHGVDCAEHWARPAGDFPNVVRHDGDYGADDDHDHRTGAAVADSRTNIGSGILTRPWVVGQFPVTP